MLDFYSFLESIEQDFIKALMIYTHNQIVTWLSWQRIRVMIRRLWVQTQLGAIYLSILLSCPPLSPNEEMQERILTIFYSLKKLWYYSLT